MNISTSNNYQSEYLEIQGIIRKKGQLTIPVYVREILNLEEGDKVAFLVNKSTANKNKKVEIIKKQSVIATTEGALKFVKPVLSAEQLRGEA
jgi:AbrB family looped-hinge helix DNA binding protein